MHKGPERGLFLGKAICSLGVDVSQNLNFNLAVDTNSAVASINQFFSAFDQGAAKAKSTLNTAFGQNLQTTVQIELKNGELVAKKVQSIKQESDRLATAVKAVNGQWGKTPNQLKRQVATLKEIQGNTQKYVAGTKKITAEWKALTDRIKEGSAKLREFNNGGAFGQIKAGLTGVIGKFAAVQTLANIATSAMMSFANSGAEFLNMASRMETLQLQLEAFAGGSDQAKAAFKSFADIAAKTPFNLEQVAGAGKILMAFGLDADQAVKSTEQLGIAAAATGGDVNLLARNLGQIAAQGQAYTRDLTQFAIQGIPIWEEMSAVTGRSVDELKKMASEGKIGFDIVNEALTNLTAEGTAFAEVAERMQETFAGRMAKIEASINELGLAFVNTFNSMDRALGGPVSNSMKALADMITWIAANLPSIATGLTAMTAAATAFMVVMNFGAIVAGFKTIAIAIQAMVTWQNISNAAAIVFNGLIGNWGAIAAAVAAGGAAYIAMSEAQKKAAGEERALQGEINGTKEAVGALTEAEIERMSKAKEVRKEQMDAYKELKSQLAEEKRLLDEAVEGLKLKKEMIKEAAQAEIDAIQKVVDKDKEKLDIMKDAHKQQMDDLKQRHDAELAIIDDQIAALRERTPQEQALYEYNKKQLIEKINSGRLDQEALLNAKARLSRMEANEIIAGKLLEKETKQAEQAREQNDLKERQGTLEDSLQSKIETQEKSIDQIIEKRDQEIQSIDQAIKYVNRQEQAIQNATRSVEFQISAVMSLTKRYNDTKAAVDRMAASLRAAAAAQRALNAAKGGGGSATGRASGGPVTGGTKYTVNELGKEAFLSASGKLSMINAPAWGEWRAPSSGTVIPAHLTKQLDIPTGGINLNSAPTYNTAAAASSSNLSGLVRAISNMSGGDNIQNSVTIQAANTTQAASDMLVSLTKIKRRRIR